MGSTTKQGIWFTDSAHSSSDPEDASGFVDAEARGFEPPQLRQFENEHGELLLSLNPDIQESDVVGLKVWSESRGNWTQIVRMV